MFTADQKAALSNLGTGIGAILQDRFFAQQAADFESNELAQFSSATAAFYQGLGTIEEPNKMAQAFLDWKNTTLMPFMTSATLRYARNERIMGVVNQIQQQTTKGMDDYIGIKELGLKQQQIDAQKAQVDIQGRQVALDEAAAGDISQVRKSEAARNFASAAADQAKAEGGVDLQALAEKGIMPPGADPQTALYIVRNLPQEERDRIDAGTLERAAGRLIESLRGKPRDAQYGGGRWGQRIKPRKEDEDLGIPTDMELAKRILVNRGDIQDLLERGRLEAKGGLETVRQFGDRYGSAEEYLTGNPALLPTESALKLRGSLDTPTLAARLMGKAPEELQSVPLQDLDQWAEYVNSIRSPMDLGPGMASVMEGGLEKNQFGIVLDMATGKPPVDESGKPVQFTESPRKNREILKNVYRRRFQEMLLDPTFGIYVDPRTGELVDEEGRRAYLDAETAASYRQFNAMGDLAIEALLAYYAKDLNIDIIGAPPGAKESSTKKSKPGIFRYNPLGRGFIP